MAEAGNNAGVPRRKTSLIGRTIGLIVMAGAVVTVFFVDWKTEPEKEPPPIRPVKTVVVGEAFEMTARQFPGRVRASESADLAFEVPGRLIEVLVNKADRVEEGEILARLDPTDYQNELEAAEAELERAKAQFERIRVAAEKNAVSQQELSDASAAYRIAQSQVNLKKTALAYTYLHATFPGVIAMKYVDNFENIRAKQPILTLQDISSVEIDVDFPEADIAVARGTRGTSHFVASFEYLPGREFDIAVKEFQAEADPVTRTYVATFAMDAPEDVYILPGMTATVSVHRTVEGPAEGAGFLVPIGAVPVDGVGNFHVWKVERDTGEVYRVHRADVEVGSMTEDRIVLRSGVEKGDRIASAGVYLLEEDQKVRLYEEREGGTQESALESQSPVFSDQESQ